jgi:hypothetical protein
MAGYVCMMDGCGMWNVGCGIWIGKKSFYMTSMQASNAQSFLSRCDEETEHGTFSFAFHLRS